MKAVSIRIRKSFGSSADDSDDSLIILKVLLDDGKERELFLRSRYLPQYMEMDLSVTKRDFTEEELEALQFAVQRYKAEQAAARLTARAEQCSQGLIRKLKARGFETSCAEAAVAFLTAMGVINDERYARLYLEYRIAQGGKSPRMLCQTLYRRGIPRDMALSALKAALDTERDSSVELHLLENFLGKKRIRGVKNQDDLRRRLRFEGFSREAIEEYFEFTGF